jgi:hypothetical protein
LALDAFPHEINAIAECCVGSRLGQLNSDNLIFCFPSYGFKGVLFFIPGATMIQPHKGQFGKMLDREEFHQRFLGSFSHLSFDVVKGVLGQVKQVAWNNYCRKPFA